MESWVQQMIQSESNTDTHVTVYALDSQTAYITWFYLCSKNESKFQVVVVGPIGHNWLANQMFRAAEVSNLTALEGNHFWLVFNDDLWKQRSTPQQIFKDAGYRVGEGFEGGQKDRRTHLFPVWR